jgi:hypothetical protein
MNGREAIKLDREFEDPFYAELDEDTNLYCVFGVQSGFAYASYADMTEAEREANRRNDELQKG